MLLIFDIGFTQVFYASTGPSRQRKFMSLYSCGGSIPSSKDIGHLQFLPIHD
jgi:hypothetical protein